MPETLFTPSTKAELGHHDENISFETTVEICGREIAEQIRSISIAIYERARALAPLLAEHAHEAEQLRRPLDAVIAAKVVDGVGGS